MKQHAGQWLKTIAGMHKRKAYEGESLRVCFFGDLYDP
jgi:hypothetical protein